MRIRLQNLCKNYDSTAPAVRGLNLEIKDGELVTILGPSGCGKSTTLLMVAGILEITGGEVYFDDALMNYVAPKERNIGMVFQNAALYPNMTVLDNITYPLKNLKNPKVPRQEQVERATSVARLVELEDLMKRKPSQLSGGQQQRVAIARALVKKPGLLLLDEPLSSLDAKLRMSMREEIRRLQQELHITTIMVTHDQAEAMSMSDMIAVLRDGVLQQYGTPDALYRHPDNWFVASFLGMPSMNSVDCTWARPGASLKVLEGGWTIPLPGSVRLREDRIREGQKLILGFRPHESVVSSRSVAAPEGAIGGRVTVVEFTGRDKLLNIECGRQMLKSYVAVDFPVAEREEVWCGVSSFGCIFDAESGENLVR